MPRPTSPPIPSVCIPASGVRAVSSAVIYSIPTSHRWVSITFDSDGGSAGNATSYLDTLSAYHVRTTWFLTGYFAQAHPDIVRRIYGDGHDVGNHTNDHANLISPPRSDSFVCNELVKANSIIAGITGHTTRPYFRPPFGAFNTQTRTLAARLGYRTFYWTIDPRDWDSAMTVQDILNSVLNTSRLKPGAIILMHVNSPHEAEALPKVIAGLEQRGYTIVPLSQLMAG
jgi:peptidoglycan-N-acetylglucosamine deacetylase